jgi:hypothetical protein
MVGWKDSVGTIANQCVVFVVAEVVRVHRATQLVGDAPEDVAQLFLVGVVHDLKEIEVSRKDAKTQRMEERRRLFFFV